ncbi:LPXTG cell wall anchor domain-containing protein [Lacticaseibacillus jixiensis]|uniref:LPXTG cell wall anchor domain-containing protein n=1 Tax=Lacticaseibacillus jixiensis TaxID=3231926 RepID=UPI0036F35E0E
MSDSKDGTFGFEAASETRMTDPTSTLMGLRNPDDKDGVAYSYVETKAPTGYDNDHGTTDNDQHEVNDEDPIQVTDTPKTILPHTGGIGIVLYVALGAALVALGTVAYKKRRAN